MTPSNGPGTDGHLATVSYLFGAPEPSGAEDDASDGRASDGHASDERASDGHASDEHGGHEARAAEGSLRRDLDAPAAGGSSSASGWYLEPGAEPPPAAPSSWADDDTDDDDTDDDDTDDDVAPEAESIVAARRFLAAVERPGSARGGAREAPSSRPGSRFHDPVETSDPARPARSAEGEERAEPRKPPAVRKASINALARKGMSSAEMTSLLESREIEPDEVAAEVERLEAAGLLDDRELAETLVRSLRERKGLGRSAINSELRRRRVDQAAIDEALEGVDVDDELERATEVAVKRAGQLSSYDRQTAERRLSAFLMRRGYSGSVVGAAVAAALGPVGPRFR